MKYHLFFLSMLLASACFGQVEFTKLETTNMPWSLAVKGEIVEAIKWTDNSGVHIVVLTKDLVASPDAPDEGYTDGSLYAYHYIVSGDSLRGTWKVTESLKECPVDMFLYFIDNTFTVTDLDKDGKAEVWMMYKNSCQGDVSPVSMKIIMYEENKKFALRGTTRIKLSETQVMGGQFTLDEAFRKGPTVFKDYAEKLWKKHEEETWEE